MPGLSLRLGQVIKAKTPWDKNHGRHVYGMITSPSWPKSPLGLFQIDHPLGIELSWAILGLWMVEHLDATILLHEDLTPYLKNYILSERMKFNVPNAPARGRR